MLLFYLRYVLRLLPLQGATAPTRDTQGVASLALGYALHWAFSPPLLYPNLEYCYSFICRLAIIKIRATASSASAAHTFHVRPRVRRSVLSVSTVDCSCVLAVWSRSASA